MESASKAAAASGGSSKVKLTFKSKRSGSGEETTVKETSSKDVGSATASTEPLNPLLIALVVHEVMGYLDVKDLLRSRQVCKLWNDQAQKALEKKSYTVNFPKCQAISRFVKVTKKRKPLPFTKFSLHDKFTSRVQNYFFNLGPQIRTLHIRINLTPKTKGLINLHNIHSVLGTTPNLENLTLHEIDIFGAPFVAGSEVTLPRLRKIQIRSQFKHSEKIKYSRGVEENLKEAVARFFSVAPNLESLEIAVPRFYSDFEISILNPVSVFFKVIRLLSTLKHLHIENKLEQAELMLLFNAKFNLESLKIGELIRESNNFNPVIPAILTNHVDTLQTLNMSLNIKPVNGKFSRSPYIQLPTLPNLKHLILDWQYELHFGDLQQVFPKLTRLDLIDVGPRCLVNVFTDFPFVEHLTIRAQPISGIGKKNINSILTGLADPGYIISAMQMFRNLGICEPEVLRYEALTLLAAAPSLRNMTNLKTLEIAVDPQLNGRIDNCTAYFALFQMQPLQKLIITNDKFSGSYIDELKKFHDSVVLV